MVVDLSQGARLAKLMRVIMKTLQLVLFLIISVSLYSCASTSEETAQTEEATTEVPPKKDDQGDRPPQNETIKRDKVRAVFIKNARGFKDCYNQMVDQFRPKPLYLMSVKLKVSPTGDVKEVNINCTRCQAHSESTMNKCVKRVAKMMAFPKDRRMADVTVTQDLSFRP